MPHPHRTLDDLARSADPHLAVDKHDIADVAIERGREPPVEPQFLGTEEGTPFGRAQVDERVMHGALDLVGPFAGQQHPGDVRLDELQVGDGMRIGLRGQQRRQMCRESRAHGGMPRAIQRNVGRNASRSAGRDRGLSTFLRCGPATTRLADAVCHPGELHAGVRVARNAQQHAPVDCGPRPIGSIKPRFPEAMVKSAAAPWPRPTRPPPGGPVGESAKIG